ncbi:hypothetical protein [Acidihalobacter ferrooxydans]|uniref:Uncharacterized protein n=1 Tax=Acidihalobacter ferrooxydans TaxID=1765967 RepID=A0A1P8UDT3_9GAMM|nr:hypothetical protein [Acidihalobacter ferrooxydans]APZ41948.1 hypothetical protein BW247_01580 [Acidihalobacter ferrooxydans]
MKIDKPIHVRALGSALLSAALAGALVLGFGAPAQATAAPTCPAQIAWVPAAKIGALLSQDSGMPEFNPKQKMNQVTYVGRFVLVPQIGVVAGLPQRPAVLISGLDAPKLRIANRVHVVEWRMINAGNTPTQLRVVEKAAGGGASVVAQCTLPAAQHKAHGKRFAYLRWFWKPAADGQFSYHVAAGTRQVSGRILRTSVPLRYGE